MKKIIIIITIILLGGIIGVIWDMSAFDSQIDEERIAKLFESSDTVAVGEHNVKMFDSEDMKLVREDTAPTEKILELIDRLAFLDKDRYSTVKFLMNKFELNSLPVAQCKLKKYKAYDLLEGARLNSNMSNQSNIKLKLRKKFEKVIHRAIEWCGKVKNPQFTSTDTHEIYVLAFEKMKLENKELEKKTLRVARKYAKLRKKEVQSKIDEGIAVEFYEGVIREMNKTIKKFESPLNELNN